MAKATPNYHPSKIESITLTLSLEEARAVYTLVGIVAGAESATWRKYANTLYDALRTITEVKAHPFEFKHRDWVYATSLQEAN